jgi:IS30 family transposase
MPKDAWELLPMLKSFSRCRLCRLDADMQEEIWQQMKAGKTYEEIAQSLGVSFQTVYRHKRHMLRAMERYLILQTEKADELKRLDLLIRYEREKRKQLELAREREERAKAALDALRDLVSADKFARIQQILMEEGDEGRGARDGDES